MEYHIVDKDFYDYCSGQKLKIGSKFVTNYIVDELFVLDFLHPYTKKIIRLIEEDNITELEKLLNKVLREIFDEAGINLDQDCLMEFVVSYYSE